MKSLNCWKMNFETLFESRVRVNVRWMGKWIYSSRPLRFEILDEQKISIWRHEPLITGRVVDHHVILPSEFYKWSKRYFLYFYSAEAFGPWLFFSPPMKILMVSFGVEVRIMKPNNLISTSLILKSRPPHP